MSGNVPFGFGMPDDPSRGPQGFDISQLGEMLQQLGRMLQSGDSSGPVNWTLVHDVARQAIAQGGDPSVTDGERRSVSDAVELASLWLDEGAVFPASGGGSAIAWSRSEWIEATQPAWQRIVEPIAEHVQKATANLQPGTEGLESMLPEGLGPDAASMLGPMLAPMMGMMRQLGTAMFSMQVGQGLAALSTQVVGAADVGVPLTSDHRPALLPRNVAEFGEGLGIEADDVRIYLALRECAHQRLFAHVPWLRARLEGAVEEYARGITIDPSRLRDAMGDFDATDPAALQEAISSGALPGLFEQEDTPAQKAALARLETLLALVEGWVDDVVGSVAPQRLPSADRLAEAVRRRRAAGGPAERTFATLIGLELRPRRLREAATIWRLLREERGIDGRDALWNHPDLLPGTDDLDDPEGFVVEP